MSDLYSSTIITPYQKDIWDTRYRMKGRQWGNALGDFPEIIDPGVILELGVGDGKNLRSRINSHSFFIGLDFSGEALRLCLQDPVLSGINLLLADACHIPLRSASVNIVFAHHILGHISSELSQVLIIEVLRILRPGGVFALTVFAEGDMRDKKGTEIEPDTYLRGDGVITRYYSEDRVRVLGKKFNLKEINRVEWPMRIRGQEYPRAIITALFEKRSDNI